MIDIKKALKVWWYSRQKKQYLKERDELLASYDDPMQMTVEQVAEYEAKKAALHKKYLGGNDGK